MSERPHGMGSTDAAPACGLSPYKTAYQLWLEKTDQYPGQVQSAAMEWGLRLENAIAQAYTERTGFELVTTPPAVHFERPWMFASPDRVVPGHNIRLVELKTASAYLADEWGDDGTDQVPDWYLLQVQHQMEVTGIDRADVAVLIGGQDFRVFHVERSQRVIGLLVEQEYRFWQCVEEMRPPDPDWDHASTPGLLAAIHGCQAHLSVELPSEAVQWASDYERLRHEGKDTEEAAAFLKARLLHLMGEAAVGYLQDGRTVQRKLVKRRAYSVDECEYTTFSIKAPKKVRAR